MNQNESKSGEKMEIEINQSVTHTHTKITYQISYYFNGCFRTWMSTTQLLDKNKYNGVRWWKIKYDKLKYSKIRHNKIKNKIQCNITQESTML